MGSGEQTGISICLQFACPASLFALRLGPCCLYTCQPGEEIDEQNRLMGTVAVEAGKHGESDAPLCVESLGAGLQNYVPAFSTPCRGLWDTARGMLRARLPEAQRRRFTGCPPHRRSVWSSELRSPRRHFAQSRHS